MTGGQAGEPALADVQREFPAWRCSQGPGRLCYASHAATGTQVRGEDPLDLRDQILVAERLRAYASEQEAPGPGPAGQR